MRGVLILTSPRRVALRNDNYSLEEEKEVMVREGYGSSFVFYRDLLRNIIRTNKERLS